MNVLRGPIGIEIAVGILWLTLAAPRAAGDVIDFDDVGGLGIRMINDDRYQPAGVLLGTDRLGLFVFGPAGYTNTLPNWAYASTDANGSFANGNVIITFVLPGTNTPAVTDAVSFYLADIEQGVGGRWSAAAFDADAQPLDAVSGTTNDEIQIAFSRPSPDIHSIIFTPSVDREGIDTLTFGKLVPDPATLTLLSVGAAGVLLKRRARRAIPK